MKKTFIILLTIALNLTFLDLHAQSSDVQKASKAVFTLTTYKADGSIIATTHGAYSGNQGEGISSFTPFVGASSAFVIDGGGNKFNVESIIGANEMYDICRFKLSGYKTRPLPQAQAGGTGKLWVVGYSTKKPTIKPLTIKSSEKFLDKYNYYVFGEEITEEIEGCPILNDAAEIVGLVQRSSTNYQIHSTDSRFYAELSSSGLSAHDPALRKVNIRIALPSNHEQARLMLMMINANDDSLNVVNTTKDYITTYPNEVDGYTAMARYEVSHNNLVKASEMLESALKKVEKKDEAYFEFSKLIYSNVIFQQDSTKSAWTLDLAEEKINKAIAVNNLPAYRHQLAQIKYAKGDYTTAFNMFDELSIGDMPTSEVFYEAAQCKSHLGGKSAEILEYVNKSVEASPKPLTNISAPYILARGVILDDMGESKKALMDYNLYDSLMLYRASADFYYTRYKCEVKLRQYLQAINDISHAAIINPSEPTYLAELASLQLRLGKYEEALQASNLCLNLTQEYSDIYLVKGVALNHLGKKEESLEAFKKAKELGDARADAYIEKFSK